jgi:hypothetical protein
VEHSAGNEEHRFERSRRLWLLHVLLCSCLHDPSLIVACLQKLLLGPSDPNPFLAMLSPFWLTLVCFFLLVYFVRAFRRLILFLLGWTCGHAWLLWRRLTANSADRREKRAYLEQNPQWREFARMTPKQQEEVRRRELARISKAAASPSSSSVTPISKVLSPRSSPFSTTTPDGWPSTEKSRRSSMSTDTIYTSTASTPSRKHSEVYRNDSAGATPTTTSGGWANPFKSSKKAAGEMPLPIYTFNGQVFK